MSKEVKFKYFLNGVETKHEAIDWTRSMSIRPIKDTNEVHITYMSYLLDKPKSNCGLSTRHKACGQGYPAIKLTNESQEVKDINDFIKTIGLFPINLERTSSADELARPLGRANEHLISKGLKQEGFKPQEVGVKHNKAKAPLDIVQTRQFPKALQALALATAFGNKKYEATDKDFLNFKRVAGGSQTYFDAAARHNAERGDIDPETELPHMIHAVWNMMAALELHIEENEIDIKEYTKNYLEHLHKSK